MTLTCSSLTSSQLFSLRLCLCAQDVLSAEVQHLRAIKRLHCKRHRPLPRYAAVWSFSCGWFIHFFRLSPSCEWRKCAFLRSPPLPINARPFIMNGKVWWQGSQCHRNYTRAQYVFFFFLFPSFTSKYKWQKTLRQSAPPPSRNATVLPAVLFKHLKTDLREEFQPRICISFIYTSRWQSKLTRDPRSSQLTLRSQTPGQLLNMSLDPEERSKTWGSRWSLLATRGVRRLRSPPPSVSVSVQLLAGLSRVSACDLGSAPTAAPKLNRVLIQSVIPRALVSGGWWRPLICLCHVCGVTGRPVQSDESQLFVA